MDIFQTIKEELKVEKWQVEAAVKLIDEGCTIPFISRYRKEATGSLNDEQLRDLDERLTYLRNLEEKKEQVLGSIEEQGKLTEELKEKILAAQTLVVVEDLYRPYRPKRKTRASVAKAKGLDGLAEYILAQERTQRKRRESGRLKKRYRERRTSSLRASPTTRTTAATSARPPWRRASSPAPPRMRRPQAYTRCTIILRSLCGKWRGTECLR